jgi:hypothetical protein
LFIQTIAIMRDLSQSDFPYDLQYFQKKKQQGIQASVEEVFSEIHNANHWSNADSSSGNGSELSQTERLREMLPQLLRQLKVETLLDAPCGDFNWMRHVALPVRRYTGGDIVRAVVERNRAEYGRPGVEFVHLNILEDDLPAADLLLCRDVLVHFSFEDVFRALHNFARSPIQYLLTTTFPEWPDNKDIATGDWRPLNLESAPFHFPKPDYVLNEGCTEAGGKFPDKSLALWHLTKLPRSHRS